MSYTLTITDLTPTQVTVLNETGTVTVSETQQTFTINYNAVTLTPERAVPAGGTTGQVLKKSSNTDWDTAWAADEENLANNTTDDLAEGTNLYYTDARADARIAAASVFDLANAGNPDGYTNAQLAGTGLIFNFSEGKYVPDFLGQLTGTTIEESTTDDLAEGATNLYYTDARARASVSVTDAGGDGSLAYNSSTGVLTYTGPSATEVRAHFSAGTGVTIAAGEISIGQAVGTTSNVTFNDLIVSGDLTVNGTTTTVNTETVNIADNQIVLNSNYTGSTPTENAGIEVERGTLTNKTLVWDETNDKWTVGSDIFVASTFEGALEGNVTGNVTGTVSSLSNHTTTDLAEGTNLYYTTARANSDFDTRLATKTTDNLTEGTNLYYTTARFDSAFAGKSTTDLTEGTNLYYTDARFDTRLATKSTTDLAEGANLYYTNPRARSAISAAGDLSYNQTTGVMSFSLSNYDTGDLAEGTNLYYTDERVDDRVSNLLVAGANVTLTYDDVANTLTIAAVEDNLSNNTTDDLAEGTTNLYYTDARVDAHLVGGTGVTYTAGTIAIGQAVGTTDSVTFNTVTATNQFEGDLNGAILLQAKNVTGGTIYKGQAVYVSGLSGDTPEVQLADASNAAKMPALGVAQADINNNATGEIVTLGNLYAINTSASNQIETGVTLSVGDVLYISATEPGNLTNVKPAGESNLIQNIGKAVRVSPNTNMTFKIHGAGRSNDTPALNSGNIFIGNGSNQTVRTTLDTSIVPENTNLYYTDARADARIGAASIDALADVVITTASTGQVLKYNGANWVNDTDAGGIALTDLSVGAEAAASDDGAISYNNSTGVFTYTPPTATGIGALANIVEDTTPTLGGDVDGNNKRIGNSGSPVQHMYIYGTGYGNESFFLNNGYFNCWGNMIIGRSFHSGYVSNRMNTALIGQVWKGLNSNRTGSFTIDGLDPPAYEVSLSSSITVTISNRDLNQNSLSGAAIQTSGTIRINEFWFDQDGTGGHTVTFAKQGGGVTPKVFGTQVTTANTTQYCRVVCRVDNSTSFDRIYVHWGDSV